MQPARQGPSGLFAGVHRAAKRQAVCAFRQNDGQHSGDRTIVRHLYRPGIAFAKAGVMPVDLQTASAGTHEPWGMSLALDASAALTLP
jgi:hypothetical protein